MDGFFVNQVDFESRKFCVQQIYGAWHRERICGCCRTVRYKESEPYESVDLNKYSFG